MHQPVGAVQMSTCSKKKASGCLSVADKLWLIRRALEIGDSWMAERDLQDWSSDLELSADADLQEGLRSARAEFAALAAFEKTHGRFSRLDRQAEEIVCYENEVARLGKASVYSILDPVDVVRATKSCFTKPALLSN
jgi:hypothetical protein